MFEEEAPIIGQEKWHLLEGCSYTYEFSSSDGQYQFEQEDEIIRFHHSDRHPCEGFINTGIYVGHLSLNIVNIATRERCGKIGFEIRSVKTDYEHDYRQMLEDIADYYTDLVLQQSAPVTQSLEIDENTSSESLYQRFAFIKSIIESDGFAEAIHKIVSNPVKKWTDARCSKDITAVKRLSRKDINQFASSSDRIPLPSGFQIAEGLNSIPRTIDIEYKKDTVDVPENQFIKFALNAFSAFCTDLMRHRNAGSRLKAEAAGTLEILSGYLETQFFRGISMPSVFNMNSPVLQRKEGYREIFQVWLLFDLAAKLNWTGGENVYEAGKKNIATLYEYWLFFKLVELISGFFNIDPVDKAALLTRTNDTIDLDIKQGRMKVIHGFQMTSCRKLNVAFYYNRTFKKPSKEENTVGKSGSWTMSMRPDYTLSIWPGNIKEDEAEEQDLITHIHFDAKYRLDRILLEDKDASSEYLDEEKKDQEKGIYKRADLLKMHAYKDAIRRTSGAYVIYPGTENRQIQGYHEIIPGLGAFRIRPGHWTEDSKELHRFLTDIREHFMNRCSAREKMAFHEYDIYYPKTSKTDKEPTEPPVLKAVLPETIDGNRGVFPDETTIIVGYYKNDAHLQWILNNLKYNVRTGGKRGIVDINRNLIEARYILLYHGKHQQLFKVNEKDSPQIYTRSQLIEEGYPANKQEQAHTQEHQTYMVFSLSPDIEEELKEYRWNISDLLPEHHLNGKPVTMKLIDLIARATKQEQPIATKTSKKTNSSCEILPILANFALIRNHYGNEETDLYQCLHARGIPHSEDRRSDHEGVGQSLRSRDHPSGQI